MTVNHFQWVGNPRIGIVLPDLSSVHRHPQGADRHNEVDVRWGLAKLTTTEAAAVDLWERLGAALGKMAPLINTVPVRPVVSPPQQLGEQS